MTSSSYGELIAEFPIQLEWRYWNIYRYYINDQFEIRRTRRGFINNEEILDPEFFSDAPAPWEVNNAWEHYCTYVDRWQSDPLGVFMKEVPYERTVRESWAFRLRPGFSRPDKLVALQYTRGSHKGWKDIRGWDYLTWPDREIRTFLNMKIFGNTMYCDFNTDALRGLFFAYWRPHIQAFEISFDYDRKVPRAEKAYKLDLQRAARKRRAVLSPLSFTV